MAGLNLFRKGREEKDNQSREANSRYWTNIANQKYAEENAMKEALPAMIANGTLCQNFHVAKHHDVAGYNAYLKNCKIKNQQEYNDLKYSFADKALFSMRSSEFHQQQTYNQTAAYNNQKREDAKRRGRYTGDHNGFVQNASAPSDAGYKAPSQNLNQQQRYEYEKQLNKNLNRALGK